MSILNYHHLRYFRAVAHEGNLTRAAQGLNLSQSALSVQIRQLEARLGHALFERRGRRLHLTEAGRIALDHADSIFATGEELLSTLRSTGTARQVLRIGALATLSRNFQMAFVKPLLGRTDVDLVLRSGSAAELLQALAGLNLDVALLNQPPPRDAHGGFVGHRLAEQPVSLIGAPDRLARSTDPVTLLRDHPVILPPLGSSIRACFDAFAARSRVRPRIAAEVEDMAMMRLLAREDIGLAVLPPIVVRDELAMGLLMEADHLPGIVETFFAITVTRRFPHPLLASMLKPEL